MSTSMHFVLYPLPATDEQINERLKETADKFNKGTSTSPPVFNQIKAIPVAQCVVGPNHLALLLEDGRVARVQYSVFAERLDLSANDGNKSSSNKGNSLASGVSALPRPRLPGTARRGRLLRASSSARGRGSSSVIMGTRHVVPAQFVPEELIAQAQVVLQGKSRNLIIRELQRTNLDVNLAVNNLLSRDDEESEDMDDSQDSYLPSDDLMSLLDAGIHNDHPSVIIDADAVFPEDVFNYSAVRVRSGSRLAARSGGAGGSERDRDASAPEREPQHMIRFGGDRSQYVSGSGSGPSSSRRWLEYALRDSGSASDGGKSPVTGNLPEAGSTASRKRNDVLQLNPLFISEQLEYWPTGDKKFTQIVALYNELVAIDTKGQLFQWKWNESEPFKGFLSDGTPVYHPKTVALGLLHERISHLSGQCVRASVATESMKVATWVDESICPIAARLEHPAQSYVDITPGDRIQSLHVCSLYTLIRLDSGAMYWWGLAPFSHRKKVWEKLRTKAKKLKPNNMLGSEVVTGVQVCLRNSPSYNVGTIGFTTAGGLPKVGQLLKAAWSVTEACPFKVLTAQEVKKLGNNVPPQPSTSKQPPVDHTSFASLKEQPPSPSLAKATSQERLEMPPPPSPASSTCSEPGASPLPKRNKRPNQSTLKEDEKKDEETWHLRDVVFLEDVKNVPVGRVLKIDGAYAAVCFQTKGSPPPDVVDLAAINDANCRLLRKDELQLVKGSSWSRTPDCFQKLPKRVSIPANVQILTMTVSNQGIHAIIKNKSKLSYVVYGVTTGKVEQDWSFPTDSQAFMGQDPSLISLYCTGENETITLLRDGNGALYPVAKDCTDAIRDPLTLDMAPAQAVGIGINPIRDSSENQKNQVAVIVLALEHQILTPAILRSDPEFVRLTLTSLEKDIVSQQIVVSERVDRNRNIMHTAVSACFPASNKPPSAEASEESVVDPLDLLGSRGVTLSDMMRRSSKMPTRSSLQSASDALRDASREANAEHSDNEMLDNPLPNLPSLPASLSWGAEVPPPSSSAEAPFFDPNEQKPQAINVLWALTDSHVLKPYMKELLCARDAVGHTPFMLAVSGRAYTAALHLFNVAQIISKELAPTDLENRKKILMSMIYPRNSNADDSPLHVLCCNDTCSFTWTGAEHINQYIFECKTCGLTGSLCCCTECARVCHKGHDCKLKKTSPTAYCDCWEKCKCKALVQGSQSARSNLLKKILSDTDLVTLPNGKGENILLFLVQTVGRQINEQKQYRPARPRSSMARKTPDLVASGIDAEMPDHDLEPPRFARKALDRILADWNAIKSLILTGYRGENTNIASIASSSRANLSYAAAEEQAFLTSQNGTALLDKFTHSLLKVGPEMLETLLMTIIREYSSPTNGKDARLVARRFVRSVARIGVVLCVELNPNVYSNLNGNNSTANSNWKKASSPQLQKCKRVFQALLPIAIEELCEIADSLIAPVRLGVARPTAPFSLASTINDAVTGSEELFAAEPIVAAGFNTNDNPNLDIIPPEEAIDFDRRGNNSSIVSHSLVDPSVAADVVVSQGDDDNEVDMNESALDDAEHEISELEQDDPAEVHEVPPEESDSESDSNPDDASYMSNVDNASAQRSATTGATAGSDVGVASLAYFSEDDSGDSSNAEDEEESEAAETEPDTEELSFMEDPIERRNPTVVASAVPIGATGGSASSTSQGVRSNLAQHLQWALRHRELTSGASGAVSSSTSGAARIPASALSGSTGLMHIDPNTVRRSANAVLPVPSTSANNEAVSMSTTAVTLSRAFSIVIRQLAGLLPSLHSVGDRAGTCPGLTGLSISYSESLSLLNHLENKLRPTWDWMVTVMDSTEGQLRFGCSLTNSSNGGVGSGSFSGQPASGGRNPVRRGEDPRTLGMDSRTAGSSRRGASSSSRFPAPHALDSNAARKDFLSYMMSLMRTHNNEHFDSLPVLDVASLKHVAYVFDAFIYYIRAGNDETPAPGSSDLASRDEWPQDSENEGDEGDDDAPPYGQSDLSGLPVDEDSAFTSTLSGTGALANKGRNHTFFKRSDSTLFLGCPPPDPFAAAIPEALPLADQPHILQPTSRREELFGVPRVSSVTAVPDGEQVILDAIPSRISLSTRFEAAPYKRPDESFSSSAGPSSFADSSAMDISGSSPLTSRPHTSVITEATHCRSPIIVSTSSLATSNKSSVIVHAASIKNNSQQGNSSKSSNDEELKSFPLKGESILQGVAKKAISLIGNRVQHDILLGRWRLALELFGRVFVDDVGIEPSSVINELGGFPVKEAKFRREMERLRNSQQRDITFKVERERTALLHETFKTLNTNYSNYSRRITVGAPALAVARVKVTFKDEPGEGTGVARSYYTAFAEAVLSHEKLPPLDSCQVGNRPQYNLIQRLKSKEKEREQHRRVFQAQRSAGLRDLASGSRESRVDARESQSMQLRYDAPPFVMPSEQQPPTSSSGNHPGNSANLNELLSPQLSPHRQQLGMRIYPRVAQQRPTLASRVTGMLLELPPPHLLTLFSSDEAMRQKVDEAVNIIMTHDRDLNSSGQSDNLFDSLDMFNLTRSSGASSKNQSALPTRDAVDDEDEEDNAPLFYQPGKRGFYSPRQGKCTPERLNAFRNVGRILGLCLLQNELCPIYFNRHVMKFILRKQIAWHDLAFFDSVLYESLRCLVTEGDSSKDADSIFAGLDLRFCVDLCAEEGGGQVELVANGRNTEVTAHNVYDYVRKYSYYRMVKSQGRALQSLRQGVFDILPNNALDGLTSEDFRLLLNGVGEINVQQLISYTSFNDESGDGTEHITLFKRWFWSIVEKMTNQEKQDLVFFWTGSPALPASEDGFQPMPTINIRPADDQHFPTANTCISRLYSPLYSSKALLRSKLLVAIKIKNFGFV